MAYKSLSAHNAACNPAFYAVQDCEKEHPVGRAFGHCNEFYKKVEQCLKEQLETHRARNRKLSQEKFSRFYNRMPEKDEKETP